MYRLKHIVPVHILSVIIIVIIICISYFRSFEFPRKYQIHSYNTRNKENFNVPKTRMKIVEYCLRNIVFFHSDGLQTTAQQHITVRYRCNMMEGEVSFCLFYNYRSNCKCVAICQINTSEF